MRTSELRLTGLELHNFRSFERFSWDGICPDTNVLVARNGLGKTAVLTGAAIALAPFAREFAKTSGGSFADTDVRRVGGASDYGDTQRSQGDVLVSATAPDLNWQITRSPLAGRNTRTSSASALKKYARQCRAARYDGAPLPVIAFYGTERLWKHASITESRRALEVEDGYRDCLEPGVNFGIFEDWVGRMWHDRANLSARGLPQRYLGFLFETLRSVLAPVGINGFEYSDAAKTLLARIDDGPWLPVRSLSDGTRALLSMVGDLVRRITLLNGGLTDIDLRQTGGIVLIDEVDLHLHPEWQQQVIAALGTSLPEVQWIVTTHSPQVVTTVPRDSVWILEPPAGIPGTVMPHHPARQTEGETSAEVLADVLGVDPMPDTPWRERLNRLEQLIASPDSEVAQEWGLLAGHFGPTHPTLRLWQARRKAMGIGS